jgi:uncharacterized protein YceK
MKRLTAVVLAGLLALPLAGCGTTADTFRCPELPGAAGPRIYGGTRLDARRVAEPGDKLQLLSILCFLDMPLSIGMDTVLLLFTVPWVIFSSE